MKKIFKVVSVNTETNNSSNGKNQRVEIQAYETLELPLDLAPIDLQTRVQLMLAGITTWDKTVPISQVVVRRLFGGMINTEGNKIKDGEMFGKLNIGDEIKGSVERFDTLPYMIGDNTVNHITVFAFAGEDAVSVANRQLGQHGSCVLFDGKPTATAEQLQRRQESGSVESRAERSAIIAELLAKAKVPAQQVTPVENENPTE